MEAENVSECIRPVRKSGDEGFLWRGNLMPVKLLHYWQWMGSDLVMNSDRGILAEFIVAMALGVADQVRIGWDVCDLVAPSGALIEVKSSAYCQAGAQKKRSRIEFKIKATQGYQRENNSNHAVAARRADAYVFALLHPLDKSTLNPIDLDQWTFFVLATNDLPATQKTITLSSLKRRHPIEVAFDGIKDAIDQVLSVSESDNASGTEEMLQVLSVQ